MLPGDLRLAIRGLLRSPAFTAASILTLALGVGANTGAFSALDALLLRPLPYPDSGRMVSVYETTLDQKPRSVAEANILDWRARAALFDSMAAYRARSFGLTLDERSSVTVIQTGMVTADFFRVTGVGPAVGRTFAEKEDATDEHLLVLSDRLWRSAFGSARVVGRKVFLNEEPYTVTGMMPAGFESPMDGVLPDAFLPLSRKDYCCARLGSLDAAARLKPGVSLDAARAELAALAARTAAEFPATNRGRSAGLMPLAEAMSSGRREPLLRLAGAALLLLVIACANVAALFLARCVGRGRDIAIRAALGAGRRQIARPFFAEAALISGAGAICGFGAAELVLRIVPAFIPGAGQLQPLRLNAGALAFAGMLAAGVTLLLGGIPLALIRRAELNGMMKARGRLRGVLVGAQVAVSVVLLLGASVLLRDFARLVATNPGFETAHAWKFGIGLPETRYDSSVKLIDFHRRLLAAIGALPGVEIAGAAMRLPLRGGAMIPGGSFQIGGAAIPIPQRPRVWVNGATPGYFEAMGIPMLQGRSFSWRDDVPGQHRVAIVNQAFARAYLKDRAPLGTLLDIRWISDINPPGVTWEIVGVAGDTRQANLENEPIPEIFLSISQVGADGAVYVIRARGDDAALPNAIAAQVERLDPRLERLSMMPLSMVVRRNLGSRAATLQLIGAFGGIALLLTALGIYGMLAFRAVQRSREIAIRIALGATPGDVRRLVVGYALAISAAGMAAGATTFYIAVGRIDPVALGAVAAAVCIATLAASAHPARRAARSTPLGLLRES